jgi:hypothetical protein
MFGTFQPEEEEVVYGITKQPKSWNPIWVNFEYWIDLFQKVFLVKRFSDKMKMLFGTPGWKPEALGGGEATTKTVTPATFQKYDTAIPASLNLYVLIHFVLIVAGTSLFLFSLNQFSWAWKIYITAMIIFSLTLVGGIFESKKWVLYLEYLRLFLISLTFFIMFYSHNYFWLVFGAQSFLFILSILWISKYFEVFTNKAEWKFDAV